MTEATDQDSATGSAQRARQRFAEERRYRTSVRREGSAQFVSDLTGDLARYERDPWSPGVVSRAPVSDTIDVVFIGGGFAALLTAARLRQMKLDSFRIVERGSDVGGTWYWNRYPGVACDVASYDYFPLLDDTGYVPRKRFSDGAEIYEYCQAIARRFDLYESALFQTTVSTTTWNDDEQMWHVTTDRGDSIRARVVVCANGLLSKPKLPRISGMETFQGVSFHTSRWQYDYTGDDLSRLSDKVVGIIGTGATAVQVIPNLAAAAKELYVFQRTPSSIELRDNWDTDSEWAASLQPGWQAERVDREMARPPFGVVPIEDRPGMSPEERQRLEDDAKVAYMLKIHDQIDAIVDDKTTADALKPWYPYLCKRPCFHSDYLPAFNRPNVHLVDTAPSGVTTIGRGGPQFGGREYPVDLLVYATGFELLKTGLYNKIVGRGGLDLQTKYSTGVRTLFGIHTHGFPNLFIMGGLQASFDFNNTMVLRVQGNHIAECIDLMRRRGWPTLTPTAEAEAWWVEQVLTHPSPLLNNKNCTPGSYNSYGDSVHPADTTYGGGFPRYTELMAEARERPDDFFGFTPSAGAV